MDGRHVVLIWPLWNLFDQIATVTEQPLIEPKFRAG